ncbi:MAG: protein translocase SEC61 complex subunit gamma [Nanoarchaeota archaeon]|nr:protein translocase SEC61 complex subunit gamma [Nanoarchaeota archaeon]
MRLNIKEKLVKLKSFIIECRRVAKVTKKPTKEEFKTIVKASAAGMAIIGAMGFIMHIVRQLLFPPSV